MPISTVFRQPHCFGIKSVSEYFPLSEISTSWSPQSCLKKKLSVTVVFLKFMNTTTTLNLDEEEI